MRSIIIKATFGVPENFINEDKEVNKDLFYKVLSSKIEEVYKETGIYISYLLWTGKVAYKEEWGCPPYGEPVIFIESTYNPYYNAKLQNWIEVNETIIKKIQEELNQTTVTVTKTESDITYFKKDADEDFYSGIYPDSCIYWAKLRPDARIPEKRDEDAGYDIYPCFDEDYMYIEPHKTQIIPTGIASSSPAGFYLQIEERGSTGAKGIQHSAGVMDSGYRGEWFLCLTNTTDSPIIIIKREALNRFKNGSITNISIVTDRMVALELDHAIIYPYEKALFQAIVLNTSNTLPSKTVTYKELLKIESKRGDGVLGSSNK